MERGKTKVWAILGWAEETLEVSFHTPPAARAFSAANEPADRDVEIEFTSRRYRLSYPVFAEVLVSQILDRDEFRAHCDRYKTRAEILDHLE